MAPKAGTQEELQSEKKGTLAQAPGAYDKETLYVC